MSSLIENISKSSIIVLFSNEEVIEVLDGRRS